MKLLGFKLVACVFLVCLGLVMSTRVVVSGQPMLKGDVVITN